MIRPVFHESMVAWRSSGIGFLPACAARRVLDVSDANMCGSTLVWWVSDRTALLITFSAFSFLLPQTAYFLGRWPFFISLPELFSEANFGVQTGVTGDCIPADAGF